MRYETRVNRAQSYLLRDTKDNKENLNALNKPLRQKEDALPRMDYRIQSHLDTQDTKKPFLHALKKDNHPELLKKLYSELVGKDYSVDIRNHLCSRATDSKGLLEQHGINPELRSKMVDWMIEVLSSYKMSEETFFRSVKMMDLFLKKSVKKQQKKDLHLIGVTSMFTAAKYEEIHSLKLQVIYEKIARKKFKKSEILEKEAEMIHVLGFRMEDVTVYDIVRHAIEDAHMGFTEPLQKYFNQIILYLSKMVLYSLELTEEHTSTLAAAIFFIGLKTLEQADPTAQPERRLKLISELLGTSEEALIEVSRKVLDLAKGFNRIYPQLLNLRKFNKFEYNPSE